MRLKSVFLNGRSPVVADRERQEMVLDVGPANARTRADEGAAFEMICSTRPVMEHQPAQADQCLGPWSGCRIERDRLTARDLEIKLQMVLQVLSNARPMMPDGDAVALQLIAWTDAGKLQKLRRVDRATRQDDVPPRANGDFLAAPDVANANGSPSFKFHARGQSVDAHLQVLSPHRRFQVCDRRAASAAAMHGHVHPTETFLLKPVAVERFGIAGLPASLDPGPVQWVLAGSICGV